MALPVLVQLSDDHGLHSPKEGCEPGTVVPGPRRHAHRHGGLGLYLGICMLPGLSGRLGSGNADRLATFLEKIKTPVITSSLPASPSVWLLTLNSFCLLKVCPFPPGSSSSVLGGPNQCGVVMTPPTSYPSEVGRGAHDLEGSHDL